jgi:endogenous inhibitor of DNA gyrase (YacG/DUF329 family)
MSHEQSSVGECPDCGREIRSTNTLISYEKDDGTTGIFAECPECDDVVEPA